MLKLTSIKTFCFVSVGIAEVVNTGVVRKPVIRYDNKIVFNPSFI